LVVHQFSRVHPLFTFHIGPFLQMRFGSWIESMRGYPFDRQYSKRLTPSIFLHVRFLVRVRSLGPL
jgi:hypothetical protein